MQTMSHIFEESSLRMYYLVQLEILKPIRYLQLSVFVHLDSSRAPSRVQASDNLEY